MRLQKEDAKDPKVYALKIWLNSLFGAGHSSVFEKIHTPNFGWDVCWLGQQIQKFTIDMLDSFGFDAIAGDTDSVMLKARDSANSNHKYVEECLNQIILIIKDNVPFPVDTFKIKIEHKIEYIMFPFSLEPVVDEITGKNVKNGNILVKALKSKKKNYFYIYEEDGELKTKIVGLPIKKDNATPLSMSIFKEVLEPEILKLKRAKFSKSYIDDIVNRYLKKSDVIESLAGEYKVNDLKTYKNPSQIQAQISKNYFDGKQGIIRLIKNNKIGKVGKGQKYCTIQEALDNSLIANDLDLDKVYKELEPFILRTDQDVIEPKEKVRKKVAENKQVT